MSFLDNLILGKPDGERRRRYAKDTSLLQGGIGDDLQDNLRSDAGYARPGMDDSYETTGHRQRRSGYGAGGGTRVRGQTGDRRTCGNVVCSNSWRSLWRRRDHPVFEGQWACGSECLGAMVRAALAREMGDAIPEDGPEQHHHRLPLGLVILAQGWITHPQLQRALEAQRSHGSGKIGEWLVSECGMEPKQVARGLGLQWNCPVLSTESFWPETMALALPRVLLEEYGVVPVRLAGRKILYVGFQDSLDASASFALEQMTGLRTESGVLPETEFVKARDTLLRCEFPKQTIAAVSDRDGLARAIAETLEHLQPASSSLVRLHRYYWLRVWAHGDSDRVAGDLPSSADGVSDYLFTIGSRVTRSNRFEAATRTPAEGTETAEDPNQESIAMNQPAPYMDRSTTATRHTPTAIKHTTTAATAYGLDEKEIEAAFGATGLSSNVEAVSEREKATGFDGVSSLIEEFDSMAEIDNAEDLSDGAGVMAAQMNTSSMTEQSMGHIVLARREHSFDDMPRRVVPITQPQILGPSDSQDLRKYMRNGFEIEPVDGEYLSAEQVDLRVTALAPEGQPTGWTRIGLLKRLKPSFRDRAVGPASGPNREE